jgi:hypothetical protein
MEKTADYTGIDFRFFFVLLQLNYFVLKVVDLEPFNDTFFFKLTIESKSIELFCTQLNSRMYKIKIKNVVHIIFVFNFSTSLFINFFVYILQIIQKLNHKHEF